MEELGRDPDVVIVGGGIAGSAMAVVLARRGLRVTVLERQRTYRDRVRGEYLTAWGVAEAQRLDLLATLLEAGGVFVTRSLPYDETVPPDVAPTIGRDLSTILPGVPGGLGVGHPAACFALREAACAAGAMYEIGVGPVAVTAGQRPTVTYHIEGEERLLACRLVVGADGRTSTVRQQAGIPIQEAPALHAIAGMLVDGVTSWPPDAYTIGTEGDIQFFIIPRAAGAFGSISVRRWSSGIDSPAPMARLAFSKPSVA